MTQGVDIVTLGCRLNAYESEVIRQNAIAVGAANVVVVNTCAVTAEAERQARQAIRKARRERPSAHLVVTGCSAQIDPARYAAMPEVDLVLGNTEKLAPDALMFDPAAGGRGTGGQAAESSGVRVRVADIQAVRETAGHLIAGFDSRTRAFVQVQQGCDHRCTFCIIPFGRGPSRSVPIGVIAEQVRALVAAGYREVVLTGVDITSYGPDLPGRPSLGQMVRRVLAHVPTLPRLRLSSLDPVEIDADLWRLIADEPRLMPHLHLSLQAGDDLILKRMKRRHCRADALNVCTRARRLRPDMAFGADLIAGFPTETDAQFQNTLDLVADAGLTWLHVFPYSARPGTPAARMPQLPADVRKARAGCLRAVGQAAAARLLAAQVGRRTTVLVEDDSVGRIPQFAEVAIDTPVPAGLLLDAMITGSTGTRLTGRPVKEGAAA